VTAAEARRAYYREWAKKNPEKLRANQKRFWEKKARELSRTSTAKQTTE
jgi:hypothetical protein